MSGGQKWLVIVLQADRARANARLKKHFFNNFQDRESALIIDQRCDSHECYKAVESILTDHDLLGPLFAIVNLLLLHTTVSELWSAILHLVEQPGYVVVHRCTPPAQSNLDYIYCVVMYSLLHREHLAAAAGGTKIQDTGLWDLYMLLRSILNGNWRLKNRLEHYCFDPKTGSQCCENLEETKEKIRSVVFVVWPFYIFSCSLVLVVKSTR